MKKLIKYLIITVVTLFMIGLLIPERYQMPCGTTASYNHQSFWYHPWTRGVNGSPHYGVDIFGKEGTEVRPSVGGHETVIGLLGRTGNAAKTPAHVHYTIVTPVPHFWLYNRVYGNGNQPKKFNWMKMFYLNPDDYLR